MRPMLIPRIFPSLCSCRGISLFCPSCTYLILSATGQTSHTQVSGFKQKAFFHSKNKGAWNTSQVDWSWNPASRGLLTPLTQRGHRPSQWDFTPRSPLAGFFLHAAFPIRAKSTTNRDRSGTQREGGGSLPKKGKWPLNTPWSSISLVLMTRCRSLPDLHRCNSVLARGWISGTRTSLAWCRVHNNLLDCLWSFDPRILLLVISPTDAVSHVG